MKNNMKKIGLVFALLFTTLNCFAEDAAKKLLDILTPLQSMQAHFEQSIVDKNGRVLEKSVGDLSLLRPGKFRWDTQKPAHQLLIADGKKIWLYDESLKQVTVQPEMNKTASPVMLLSDPTSKLTEQFNITFANKDSVQPIFTLSPKNKSEMFQRIQLFFDSGKLSQMQLSDNLGQKTIIKFTDVKTNTSLNASLFEFTVPKGVDVVPGQ